MLAQYKKDLANWFATTPSEIQKEVNARRSKAGSRKLRSPVKAKSNMPLTAYMRCVLLPAIYRKQNRLIDVL